MLRSRRVEHACARPLNLIVRRRAGGSLQYLENSALALRAAHYALARDGQDQQFLLFPMIHIGTPEYYSQVRLRLEACDAILFEGVKSWRVWFMLIWARSSLMNSGQKFRGASAS